MIGKLPPDQLKKYILDKVGHRREEVVLGGSLSEDCAVLKLSGYTLASSDPITAASSGLGKLSVEVSVNDIAAAGGEPVCAILTLLAPPGTPPEELAAVMEEAEATAALRGVEIAGGHTEFTDAVNRLITVTTVIGKADRLITSARFSPGESLLLTKTAGLEGTGILAAEQGERLLRGGMTAEELRTAREIGQNISVLAEGRILRELPVSALHDVTEGGVFGAAVEMAQAAGLGAELWEEAIPVHPVTRKLCSILGLSPFKLISSGSMLIVSPKPGEVQRSLAEAGIPCAVIGRVEQEPGVRVRSHGATRPVTDTEDHLHQGRGTVPDPKGGLK